MWRNDNGGIYLESGEVAVLADVARRAIPPGPATHPRHLLLAALATALGEMVEGPGAVLTPAPAAVVRRAAQDYLRQPTGIPPNIWRRHACMGAPSILPA